LGRMAYVKNKRTGGDGNALPDEITLDGTARVATSPTGAASPTAADPQTATPVATSPDHWSATSADPNDPAVVQARAKVLARAWRPAVTDRISFLRERLSGRSVLDIGCVAHDGARMSSDAWVHRHIAEVSSSCVGVDVLSEGIETMRARGYDAVQHDLRTGLGPLSARGPFQAIVAGELIEHVSDLDMLFAIAAEGLTADGELIITTPNPYAPARVRAGQCGDVWENVDHIVYAFPSGIAELATRHGLILAEACTTELAPRKLGRPVQWVKRTLRRSHWHRRGFSTTMGTVRPVVLDRLDRLDWVNNILTQKVSSRHRFVGETFIYVVQRGPLR